MRIYTDDNGTDFWFECVQTALYDDRLTNRMKKRLVGVASGSSNLRFSNQYKQKLDWLKLIGGKENYELRRRIEYDFLQVFNQISLSNTELNDICDEIKVHASVKPESYFSKDLIKERLSNESIIRLSKKYYKKLSKNRQYNVNSFRKKESWKSYFMYESVGSYDN